MNRQGPSKWISTHREQLTRLVACLLFPWFHTGLELYPLAAHSKPLASFKTQDQMQVISLETSKPIEREIAGGQSHSYQVMLGANQYLEVAFQQLNVNLAIVLLGLQGNKLLEADVEKRKRGVEMLTFIADAPGNYQIEVRPAEQNATSGRYEAKILALRAPTAEERALEEARRLHQQSRDLRQKGEYDEALPLAERALGIREKVLGPNHPLVADSLHFIAIIYDDKHDYVRAEPLNDRALAIRAQALGPDHPDVARSLFNLAWIYKVRQEFAKAESFYKRSLAIQEKAFGLDHPELATTLNDLAVLYSQKGEYDQAILINQRVLAIRERALGPDDSGVAKVLNNLARVYERKGDYTQAEALLLRSLAIWEKALGPNHPEVAFAVDSLARIYSFKGDYVKSEPLYLRALAIREKALGPDHPEVATSLNNLAVLYRQKGDYSKAEPLLNRDLAITEKGLGPNHRFVAPTLNNLAGIYVQQGDFARAEPLYQRALAIQERALGPNHQDVGWCLFSLGHLYAESKKGDMGQAESFFQRSLLVLEKALGSDHHRVASPLSGLALLNASRGNLEKAEGYYRRALVIQEKALGPNHPEVAQSLGGLARLYAARGDASQAIAYLSRSFEIREQNLNHNLPVGSERQKLEYLKLFAEDTDLALSLHKQLAPHDSAALQLALNTLLRRKGRALDAMTDNIAALRRRALPQDQDLFGRLSAARSQLAMVTLRGPGAASAAAYRLQIKLLQDELDQLETDVSARSNEFRAEQRAVTLDLVRSAIPEGAVLVEFALYRPRDLKTKDQLPPRYSAYLLTNQGLPQWADLGDADIIDRALKAWHQALRDPVRADVQRLARTVDAKVMQPVRALLEPSQHLLISPDGPLNLIPFAALVDEHGRYLIERLAITYVTSGRDLLRLQVPRASRSNPLIVAAPNFGEPALVASLRDSQGQTRKNDRNPNGKTVDYSQVFFGPLPGVSDEVRALRELLPAGTFLLKEQATETALKSVSGPNILHVATHGFFLQDQKSTTNNPGPPLNRANVRLGKWSTWVENPLLRSGLALAGANQGSSGADDGVLTALEAAGLDLWGTKLVVLSACDTGVGEVKNGEGVYGLRRALVLAGAESQMISLWPVSDRSTRDLMIGYYRRLTQGAGRSEALRQAQLQLLQSKVRTHPYYWASFIQSGEWATLEGRR